MANESTKLQRLREIRANIAAGKYTKQERARLSVKDTDGRDTRLDADNALDVLDRRIAAQVAEEAQA